MRKPARKLIVPTRRFFARFGRLDVEKAVAIAVHIAGIDRRVMSVDDALDRLRAARYPMGRTTTYRYLRAGRWLLRNAK